MTTTEFSWNTLSPDDQKRFPPQLAFEAGLRHHHIANTAYPIHHSTTMRPYRVPASEHERIATAAWKNTKELGLYVHVPFCAARCKYCEYAVVDRNDPAAQADYVDALEHEFALWHDRIETDQKTLIGFDIGGGTPSFVSTDHIQRIVTAATSHFQIQPGMTISIETTPAIAAADPAKICAYKRMGIDRISMGVQTTHLQLARSLGREYEGLSMLERAVHNIRDAGFKHFNIDLMYGFAGQSSVEWLKTVKQTMTLEPEYITLYQMRYKGTRMQDQAVRVTREYTHQLGRIATEALLQHGYLGWPGKNTFSKISGDVGTSDYLTERVVKGTPYLGLGLGAQSLSRYTLAYNQGAASKTLKPYLHAIHDGHLPIQDMYYLPVDVAMAKMISVSFYFGQVDLKHFETAFGVRFQDRFTREWDFVLGQGLMELVGPALRLTDKGVRQYSGVIALFYSGAVKDYLIHLESTFGRMQKEAA
jgi:oxygen-independent coproporphyrinogen-3 oxidase